MMSWVLGFCCCDKKDGINKEAKPILTHGFHLVVLLCDNGSAVRRESWRSTQDRAKLFTSMYMEREERDKGAGVSVSIF